MELECLGILFIIFFIVGFIFYIAHLHVSILYNKDSINTLETKVYIVENNVAKLKKKKRCKS